MTGNFKRPGEVAAPQPSGLQNMDLFEGESSTAVTLVADNHANIVISGAGMIATATGDSLIEGIYSAISNDVLASDGNNNGIYFKITSMPVGSEIRIGFSDGYPTDSATTSPCIKLQRDTLTTMSARAFNIEGGGSNIISAFNYNLGDVLCVSYRSDLPELPFDIYGTIFLWTSNDYTNPKGSRQLSQVAGVPTKFFIGFDLLSLFPGTGVVELIPSPITQFTGVTQITDLAPSTYVDLEQLPSPRAGLGFIIKNFPEGITWQGSSVTIVEDQVMYFDTEENPLLSLYDAWYL
jgi:hypothetical protein